MEAFFTWSSRPSYLGMPCFLKRDLANGSGTLCYCIHSSWSSLNSHFSCHFGEKYCQKKVWLRLKSSLKDGISALGLKLIRTGVIHLRRLSRRSWSFVSWWSIFWIRPWLECLGSLSGGLSLLIKVYWGTDLIYFMMKVRDNNCCSKWERQRFKSLFKRMKLTDTEIDHKEGTHSMTCMSTLKNKVTQFTLLKTSGTNPLSNYYHKMIPLLSWRHRNKANWKSRWVLTQSEKQTGLRRMRTSSEEQEVSLKTWAEFFGTIDFSKESSH